MCFPTIFQAEATLKMYRAGGAPCEDYSSSLIFSRSHDSCLDLLSHHEDIFAEKIQRKIPYVHVSRLSGSSLPFELEVELVRRIPIARVHMRFQPEQILSWKRPLDFGSRHFRCRIDKSHTAAYSMQSYRWLAPVISRAERKAVLVSLGQQCGMMRWLGAVQARLSRHKAV